MIFLVAWFACGLVSVGLTNAYFGRKFQSVAAPREDLGMAIFLGLFGPIALVVSFLMSGFGKYGWSLRCPPAQREVKP